MTMLKTMQWQTLADALRKEIQEYGWLLNLLEQQQKGILERRYATFPDLTQSVDEQLQVALASRTQRESLHARLCDQIELPAKTRLSELLTHLPESAQGLIDALLQELRRLVQQLQRRSGQNKLLLARAQRVTLDMLALMKPGEVNRTYSTAGAMQLRTPAAAQRLALHA